LYVNGNPGLIDIGRENYVAKTFSSRRYEIWTMQSQYHNVPKINGVDQAPGREYEAKNTTFSADKRKALFSADISGGYPEEAGVKKWVRTYELERGKKFIISDAYELEEVTGKPTALNFVTPCKVRLKDPDLIEMQGEDFVLEMKYDPKKVSPDIEFNEVTDSKLKQYWPGGITRIVFTLKNVKIEGKNEIVITETN